MLTLEEARSVAQADLDKGRAHNPDVEEVVILDQYTIAREWGWVFFYQSRRYVETGDRRHFLGGNAPLIVNRFDGSVRRTGTARPTEEYVERYERSLGDLAFGRRQPVPRLAVFGLLSRCWRWLVGRRGGRADEPGRPASP